MPGRPARWHRPTGRDRAGAPPHRRRHLAPRRLPGRRDDHQRPDAGNAAALAAGRRDRGTTRSAAAARADAGGEAGVVGGFDIAAGGGARPRHRGRRGLRPDVAAAGRRAPAGTAGATRRCRRAAAAGRAVDAGARQGAGPGRRRHPRRRTCGPSRRCDLRSGAAALRSDRGPARPHARRGGAGRACRPGTGPDCRNPADVRSATRRRIAAPVRRRAMRSPGSRRAPVPRWKAACARSTGSTRPTPTTRTTSR